MEIRKLVRKDVKLYKSIRLEALLDAPDSFGSSYEKEKGQPFSFFEERIATNDIYGAFIEGEIAGVIGISENSFPKTQHKAMLWGMFVKPEERGKGIAKTLTETALDALTKNPDIELVQLCVISGNDVAKQLYTSLGFELWGVEEKALKVGGEYFTEEHMVKRL